MVPYRDDIDKAVAVLREGGVILYPTDTIWGLGCDAENEAAVQRIFRLKKRPPQKSFILLMDSPAMVRHYLPDLSGRLPEEMSQTPRPTTYILPGAKGLAPSVVAADGTVAVRLPQDDFCRILITAFGKALVSTSANFTGTPPPAHFGEIDPGLIKECDYVVQWRRDDRTPARPSRILRILPDGTRKIIRK
jgi:L-threonylcarbamoyladenylate synthase